MTYSCVDPASCQTPLVVEGVDLNASSSVTLTFDDQGIADFTNTYYDDAGLISISASGTVDGAQILRLELNQVLVYPACTGSVSDCQHRKH